MAVRKGLKTAWALLVILLLLSPETGSGEEKKTEEKKGAEPAGLFIKYEPPKLGKPGKRVGGATRGTQGEIPKLVAVVPDHTALAASSQPLLCWYLSKSANVTAELTVNGRRDATPLLERRLTGPLKSGIQCAGLREFGISLSSSVEYAWFVSLIPDPAQRSKDIVCGGSIMVKEPETGFREKLTGLTGTGAAALWAEHGYWYDAWAAVTEALKAKPGDPATRALAADLFRQAGLTDIPVEGK
jgi:hypothetical protein